MEVGGWVALLLILAVLPAGYTVVKGNTYFQRWEKAFSSPMITCREDCRKAPKDENYLTWWQQVCHLLEGRGIVVC